MAHILIFCSLAKINGLIILPLLSSSFGCMLSQTLFFSAWWWRFDLCPWGGKGGTLTGSAPSHLVLQHTLHHFLLTAPLAPTSFLEVQRNWSPNMKVNNPPVSTHSELEVSQVVADGQWEVMHINERDDSGQSSSWCCLVRIDFCSFDFVWCVECWWHSTDNRCK